MVTNASTKMTAKVLMVA
jgi:hypothetical protein